MKAVVNDPKRTPSKCTARSRPNVNQEMPPRNSGLWNWIETRMPTRGNRVSHTIAQRAQAVTRDLSTRSGSAIVHHAYLPASWDKSVGHCNEPGSGLPARASCPSAYANSS